jgi:hypothetical protein
LAKELIGAGAADRSCGRRATHRHCGHERGAVSLDLELPPPGECVDAPLNRRSPCGPGSQSPNHLHARRTFVGQAMNDPIIDEVRRVRDAHASRFNYDLDAIFRDIKEQERRSGRTFVSFPQSKADPKEALHPSELTISAAPSSPAKTAWL